MKPSILIARFRKYRAYMAGLQARTPDFRLSVLNFRDWVYLRGWE